jgi:hypothetical protein
MKRKQNNYRVEGQYAYIEISKLGVVYESIIDKKDLPQILPFAWHLNQDGYAITQERTWKRKQKFLHHIILSRKEGLETDHINRNRLDNRKLNLRYATREMNTRNTSVRKDSASGIKGVRYHEKLGKWSARIHVGGQRLHLGLTKTAEEAKELYKKAVAKYHK